MGAKTALLVYADGDIPARLRQAVTPADAERTAEMMRRLYPGWAVEPQGDARSLWDNVYPGDGEALAGSWPGIDVLCDRRVMLDRPSELPAELVTASAGRRVVLHAMHSVVDWLAFAVWEDGKLVRSLSLSPDSGIIENIGDPLPFEEPYWAGECPADVVPWPDEEVDEDEQPYPLPFHPLDMGEDALRALCGFIIEGRPSPDDVDADAVVLHGFRTRDPEAPDPAVREAAVAAAAAAMGPGRFYRLGPDGTLVKRDGP